MSPVSGSFRTRDSCRLPETLQLYRLHFLSGRGFCRDSYTSPLLGVCTDHPHLCLGSETFCQTIVDLVYEILGHLGEKYSVDLFERVGTRRLTRIVVTNISVFDVCRVWGCRYSYLIFYVWYKYVTLWHITTFTYSIWLTYLGYLCYNWLSPFSIVLHVTLEWVIFGLLERSDLLYNCIPRIRIHHFGVSFLLLSVF